MAINIDLAGKVALVTGAGRGIGRAIAIGLAEAGAKVCVTARTEVEIDEMAEKVRGLDDRRWRFRRTLPTGGPLTPSSSRPLPRSAACRSS